MKLKKSTYNRIGKKDSYMPELLRILGVPEYVINAGQKTGKRGGFWIRHAGNLDILLKDIKECYLKKIKNLHPDKKDGNLEEATVINAAWKEVQRRFNYRMNPPLIHFKH